MFRDIENRLQPKLDAFADFRQGGGSGDSSGGSQDNEGEGEKQDGNQSAGGGGGQQDGSGQAEGREDAGDQGGSGGQGDRGDGASGNDGLIGVLALDGGGRQAAQKTSGVSQSPEFQGLVEENKLLRQFYEEYKPFLADLKAGKFPQSLTKGLEDTGTRGRRDEQPMFLPSRYDPEREPELYLLDQIEQKSELKARAIAKELAEDIVGKKLGELEGRLTKKEQDEKEKYEQIMALDNSLNQIEKNPKLGPTYRRLEGDIEAIVSKNPSLKSLDPKIFGTVVLCTAWARRMMSDAKFSQEEFARRGSSGARNAQVKGSDSLGGKGGTGKGGPDKGGAKGDRKSAFLEDLKSAGNKEVRGTIFE